MVLRIPSVPYVAGVRHKYGRQNYGGGLQRHLAQPTRQGDCSGWAAFAGCMRMSYVCIRMNI